MKHQAIIIFQNKTDREKNRRPAGFTMIEVLIASTIMVIVIIGALTLYSRSNQISEDQQPYAE
ncbi:MAG TPA: hypothetical protein DCR87_02440, partial [Acidobacteria bacterium]|nr:hypothetical protein [Acidobacteriota bacterium]